MKGKIRKLFKGFGFIFGDDGREYFFHSAALDTPETRIRFDELFVNQVVEFEDTETEKGLRAEEVRLL